MLCGCIQGVQFDLDSPLTLRLEFARSNTKATCTKPQHQQPQQPSLVVASSKTTAQCLHHNANAVSVASFTGCESEFYVESLLVETAASAVIESQKYVSLNGYRNIDSECISASNLGSLSMSISTYIAHNNRTVSLMRSMH